MTTQGGVGVVDAWGAGGPQVAYVLLLSEHVKAMPNPVNPAITNTPVALDLFSSLQPGLTPTL